MHDSAPGSFPWRIFFSELISTALLVLIGLSVVIFMWGSGSPMARILPSEDAAGLVMLAEIVDFLKRNSKGIDR